MTHDDRGAPRVELDGGHLRFVAADDDRGEGIACIRVALCDRSAAEGRATARGCVDPQGRVRIGGVRFDLVAA